MILKLLILALLTISVSATPNTQTETALSLGHGKVIPYLQFLPAGFKNSSEKKWPLILFLHGRGESNGPLAIVKKWGPPKIAEEQGLPYIVIAPQCPRKSWWHHDDQQAALTKLLSHVQKTLPVDRKRTYLTGLSMGGFGSWKMATRHPDTFAAVIPICGGGEPEKAEKLIDLPIWAWHGDADEVVPVSKSIAMVKAIKKAGGKKVKFTNLRGVAHNSWSPAYGDDQLWKWLKKQHR